MRKHKLNLRMFNGEGGAAAAPGAQAPGVTVQAAVAQLAETRPASEETTPDLGARFDELVSGEFKEVYNQRMQQTIQERLRNTNAKHAKIQKELQDKNSQMSDFIGLIGSKYGITDGNLDNIRKAVENDTAYWEDAAAREGVSVEQYKYMKQIERENAQFRKTQDEAARIQRRDQLFAKWTADAEDLGKRYKGFDLRKEMENPQFGELLGAGVDMRTAYEVLHHDEIVGNAMAYTAQKVAKRQIDAIKNGQSHPAEGAIASTQTASASKDFSKMTLEEMENYAKRARNGEKITFREG